jgi:hypothetical protein
MRFATLRVAAIIALMTVSILATQAASAASRNTLLESAISSAQRAEAQQRYELAKRIVDRVAADAQALGLQPSWRQSTLVTLLDHSSKRLTALAGYTSHSALMGELAKPSPKLLGDASNDLVFKPFVPCRYIDTRNAGGKIAGIRTFDLANNGGVYGGSAACDPRTVAAVTNEDQIGALAVNIALIDTSAGAPGFLTMRPAGSTQLTALANWYVASASAQDSNAAVVAIDQTVQADEIEILSSGAVHVIVDLLGAFVAPSATALSCTTVQTNVTNAAPGQFSQFNSFCPAGYSITGGGCHYYNTDGTPATENTVLINKNTRAYDAVAQTFLNGWLCSLTNNDAVKSFNFGNRSVCCRVPGR